MLRVVTHLAVFIALLLIMQGILCLAVSAIFVRIVRILQTSPLIYLAIVLRVTIGLVLVCAASASRAPRFLRGLGVLIVIGGVSRRLSAFGLLTSFSIGGLHKDPRWCVCLREFP
jgi:hypothetical protein